MVDTNLGNMKLNNILNQRLLVPVRNARNPDQVYQLIAQKEEIVGPGCRWDERSIDTKVTAALFWYANPISVVHDIVEHPSVIEYLLYMPVQKIGSNGEIIYADLWMPDWWWRMWTSFLVLSEIISCQIFYCIWVS